MASLGRRSDGCDAHWPRQAGNGVRAVPMTEADTCRTYVLPKLYAAGWTDDQIREQRTFTDGCIVAAGKKVRRRKQKRADYLPY